MEKLGIVLSYEIEQPNPLKIYDKHDENQICLRDLTIATLNSWSELVIQDKLFFVDSMSSLQLGSIVLFDDISHSIRTIGPNHAFTDLDVRDFKLLLSSLASGLKGILDRDVKMDRYKSIINELQVGNYRQIMIKLQNGIYDTQEVKALLRIFIEYKSGVNKAKEGRVYEGLENQYRR